MKSAVETLTPTRVKLTVQVPFADLKPRLDAAYRTIGRQVNVPGFRKGKVPARIIDQRFGRGSVVQEAVNDALPEYYTQAVKDNNLRPLGQPDVNLTELPIADGQDLAFEAEFDVVPSFELPDFTGIAVEVDPWQVDEADVSDRMDDLRARFGSLVTVDRPAVEGDFTSIDLSATADGEQIDAVTGVSYEIGSKTMIDGLDEALIGSSAGDTVEFVSTLAGGERAGQASDVTVTLQSVKERELPELDDEFAQDASEFDTMGELEADLRAQAERAARFEQGVQARDKVLAMMLEMTDIPLPEHLVEEQVQAHLQDEDRLADDVHRAEVTTSTRQLMRTQFLLDALVQRDNVEVGQGEVIEYLMMTAQQYGMNPNEFAQRLDSEGQISAMVIEVGRRKALAAVLEGAAVTDTEGTVVDLSELDIDDADDDDADDDDTEDDNTEDDNDADTEDVDGDDDTDVEAATDDAGVSAPERPAVEADSEAVRAQG